MRPILIANKPGLIMTCERYMVRAPKQSGYVMCNFWSVHGHEPRYKWTADRNSLCALVINLIL